MRSRIAVTFLALVLVMGANAQNNTPKTLTPAQGNAASVAQNPTVGKLIAQLTDHISNSAFTPEFVENKKGWTEKANAVTDMNAVTYFVQSLQSGLKPSSFGPNWNNVKTKWLADASVINNAKDAAALVKTLAANLNITILDSQWAQVKPTWQTRLNTVNQ